MLKRPDRKIQPRFADPRGIGDRDRLGDALIFDQSRQTLARALGIAGHQDRPLWQLLLDMIRKRRKQADLFLLTFRREIAADPSTCINRTGPACLWQGFEMQDTATGNCRSPSIIVQIQKFGRNRFINRVHPVLLLQRMFAGFVLINHRLPTCNTRRIRLIIKRNHCFWQVVKQRFQLFVKEGQPVVDTLMFAPCADGFIKRIIRSRSAKLNPVILTEPRDRRVIQYDLGHGCQFDHFQFFGGALSGRIKAAHTVQNIPEQIKPHRPAVSRRENINNATPNGIVARLHHRRRLGKAHTHQKPAQCAFIDLEVHLRLEGRFFQDFARRYALGGRIQRGQQHELLRHPMHKSRQCGHTHRCNVGVGRHTVIGQTIPPRKSNNRHVRLEEGKCRLHRGQTFVVTCHMNNRPACLGDLVQNQTGVKTFWRAAHFDMLLCRHFEPNQRIGEDCMFWNMPQSEVTKIESMPRI